MTLNATSDRSECTEGVYIAYQECPNVRDKDKKFELGVCTTSESVELAVRLGYNKALQCRNG